MQRLKGVVLNYARALKTVPVFQDIIFKLFDLFKNESYTFQFFGLNMTVPGEDPISNTLIMSGAGGFLEWPSYIYMRDSDLIRVKDGAFFDIGANVGTYSLLLSSMLKDNNPRIYAFEPHPVAYRFLIKNIRDNNMENIILAFNNPVGDKTCLQEFYCSKSTNISSLVKKNALQRGSIYRKKLQTYSLDDFCGINSIKGVSFIKIDVEGYEIPVLNGGYNIISRDSPHLLIEICDKTLKNASHSSDQLIKILKELKYKRVEVFTDTKRYTCKIDRLGDYYNKLLKLYRTRSLREYFHVNCFCIRD